MADESYVAAKKKTQAERQQTVQETRVSASNIAEALVGMVMASSVPTAEAQAVEKTPYFDYFDTLMMVLTILGAMTVIWFLKETFVGGSKDRSSKMLETLEIQYEEVEKERDELKELYGERLKELHHLEEVADIQKKEIDIKNREVQRLKSDLQAARNQAALSSASTAPRTVFTTNTGECWHRDRQCDGLRNAREIFPKRPCKMCG